MVIIIDRIVQQPNINMHTPRVSILMPIYNVEQYLREAMDSMLSQTFTDFELICLDDCSPDHSTEILDGYSDPRIVRYRGEKNVGLANILNIGMDMARGEYIARMDSDDISLPNRLQVQVDYLDNHPEIDLVSVGMQLFGDRNEVWVRDIDTEAVKFRALFHSPILHASSMWRRTQWNEHRLRFRQEMVPAEDYDMWTRALTIGLKLVNLPDVLYQYRIYGETQVSAQRERSAARCREVQEAYIQTIFPYADVHRLAGLYSSNPDLIRDAMMYLLDRNVGVGYFDDNLLYCRLRRYYQSALYATMQKYGIIWSQLLQLRLPQIVKLLFQRLKL